MPNDVASSSIVVALQGRPISTDAPSTGDSLVWNGSQWEPTLSPTSLPPDGYAGGNLGGSYPNPTVVAIQNNPVSSQMLGASQDGYVLTWDNTDGCIVARNTGKAVCGAYCTSTQTISSVTQLTNWTVKFDTASGFNTSNSNYVIPTTGYYQVDAQLFLSGTLSGGAGAWLTVYLNGTSTNDKGITLVSASGQTAVNYSTIVYATAGQTLDLRLTVGESPGLTVQANSDFNYMNIHQL